MNRTRMIHRACSACPSLCSMQSASVSHVDQVWWDALADGTKRVEGRRATSGWLAVKPGDTRGFVSNTPGQLLVVEVTDVRLYSKDAAGSALVNFLVQEGIRNVLPGIKTLKDACEVYHKFWSDDEIDETGMVAIEVKVLSVFRQ